MSQQPSIGRIVHFRLTADQAVAINRRRDDFKPHPYQNPAWPKGAQAHVGNHAVEGEVVPLIIVRVWPDEFGTGKPGVNGQAILDGNDALWVTSAAEGTEPGQWSWPPRT